MSDWVKVKKIKYMDNYEDCDVIYLNTNQICSINIDTNEITLPTGVIKLKSTDDIIKISKAIFGNSESLIDFFKR